ncbi:hypothetical protein ACFSAA_07595 [Sphingomonas qilianensis]
MALKLTQGRDDTLDKLTRFGLRSHGKLIDLIEMRDGPGTEHHWLNHMNAAGTFWLSELSPTSLVDLLE